MQTISIKRWYQLSIYCGFSAFISYFLAAFAPLGDKIALILAFAFGPLLMLSSVGLFYLLRNFKDSINLRIAVLFNIVATTMVSLMLVVQLTTQEFHQIFKTADTGAVSKEQLKWIFKEVNSIQLGIDLVWDIFISLGTFFFALAMFHIRQMNKVISIFGLIFSFLLLVFNLVHFPNPPSEVGSIDFGPFVALWYIIFIIWLTIKQKFLLSYSEIKLV